jgi:hypothetical protein
MISLTGYDVNDETLVNREGKKIVQQVNILPHGTVSYVHTEENCYQNVQAFRNKCKSREAPRMS